MKDNSIRYKCPRCGHITTSSSKTHAHATRRCGARGCQRSLSRRHILE